MSFKHFINLQEWFHNDTKLQEHLKNELSTLDKLIISKKFYDAEILLEKLWKRLTKQLDSAKTNDNSKEIEFIIPLLNKLHQINISNNQIRNIKTQSF
jgi:hypothetical protein